jgi:hypothetical protein
MVMAVLPELEILFKLRQLFQILQYPRKRLAVRTSLYQHQLPITMSVPLLPIAFPLEMVLRRLVEARLRLSVLAQSL